MGLARACGGTAGRVVQGITASVKGTAFGGSDPQCADYRLPFSTTGEMVVVAVPQYRARMRRTVIVEKQTHRSHRTRVMLRGGSEPMLRTIAILFVVAVNLGAGPSASWQNLAQLAAGQSIEVVKTDHTSVKGVFISVSEEMLRLKSQRHEVAVPRAEISRVFRLGTAHAITWIGLAAGAGVGAGLGAGAGQSYESGNLAPAAAGVGAGIGALVGCGIGELIGHSRATVYRLK
jgi:hypothetical protein